MGVACWFMCGEEQEQKPLHVYSGLLTAVAEGSICGHVGLLNGFDYIFFFMLKQKLSEEEGREGRFLKTFFFATYLVSVCIPRSASHPLSRRPGVPCFRDCFFFLCGRIDSIPNSIAIEAAIVRIMKARKTIGHPQLVAEVLSQLSFFRPNPKVSKSPKTP